MSSVVFVLHGYANDNPAESWAVRAFADAQAADKYRQEVASATKRIIQNINRATKIRGKPFSSAEIARFCANNSLDPSMKFSKSGVSYRILTTSLAPGLAIISSDEIA